MREANQEQANPQSTHWPARDQRHPPRLFAAGGVTAPAGRKFRRGKTPAGHPRRCPSPNRARRAFDDKEMAPARQGPTSVGRQPRGSAGFRALPRRPAGPAVCCLEADGRAFRDVFNRPRPDVTWPPCPRPRASGQVLVRDTILTPDLPPVSPGSSAPRPAPAPASHAAMLPAQPSTRPARSW